VSESRPSPLFGRAPDFTCKYWTRLAR